MAKTLTKELAPAGQPPSLRIMPVAGDYMEPTLRRGDFVMTVPCSRYEGEWTYVIGPVPELKIVRAQFQPGAKTVRTYGDHKSYPPQDVPLAWFNEHVLARVVAHIDVYDSRPFART